MQLAPESANGLWKVFMPSSTLILRVSRTASVLGTDVNGKKSARDGQSLAVL